VKNNIRGLRELAARSGRIVEFGDGEADEAVLAALKAAASADESLAQRAMLLKSGLVEMVKGQLVINERGYAMMQKAGMPPKLTPEERREEIAGEKRLSRFNHGEHGGHGVEFAAGDQILKLGFKAASAKGVHPYEAAAMAQQLHGPILATAMTKKVGKGDLSDSSLVRRAERKVSARMIREYRGVLRRGAKREFARGDYAIPAMKKILNSPSDRHLHEVPGLVGALRGDSAKMQAHYAALGKRNKYYASMAEGAASPGVLRHLRSWAAGAIRRERSSQREFARGDYAIPFLKNALQSMKGQNPPAWAARRSFPPADGYTQLTPIPNPIEEAVNLGHLSGSLKKPSKRWSGDLIDPHPIFSGQKRTNPIRKDVAKLIKQIRSNATPSPLSDASYAQAGQKRTWGFRF
jgi:hypothetical protein